MKIENKKTCKLCDNSSQTERKFSGECQKHGNDSKNNGKGVISIHDILGIDNEKRHAAAVSSASPQPTKHLTDDKSNIGFKRHHIDNFLPTTAAAAVAAASQYVSQFPGLFTPYLNEMVLAHLFRGYYQPAGPLITSHLVGGPQNLSKSSIPSPLDSSSLQQPQQTSLINEGTDLSLRPSAPPPPQHTFRYSSQPTQPQPQSQQQPPIQLSPAPPVPGSYSRPMHQMHCPTYSPSYYAYSQDMCYSPPYQPPYYPPKVYPSPYRRYMPAATYYSPQPSEMYETTGPQGPSGPTPTSGSLQPQQGPLPPSGGQLVPSGPNVPQHLEHYAPYYSGYNPGGGQCYTRSIQPPYMDAPTYPNNCPCPMQSCSKNVLTGPLIGSKTGKGPGQTNNHLVAPSHDSNLLISSSMTSTPSSISGGSITSTTVSVPPPKKITCKLEQSNVTMNLTVKPKIINPSLLHTVSKVDVKTNGIKNLVTHEKEYEKTVFVPHHPNYTLNPKLVEPEMSISPARGSTGLPGIPPIQDSAVQPMDIVTSLTIQSNPITAAAEILPGTNGIGRRARVGKSMAREMVKQSHQHFYNPQSQPLDAQQLIDRNNEALNLAQHNRTAAIQHNKVFPASEIKESHPDIVMPMPITFNNTNNAVKQLADTLIKKEDVKKEREVDVIILDKSESDSSTTHDFLEERLNNKLSDPMPTNSNNKTSASLEINLLKRSIDDNEIVCLDDTFDGSEAVKRRKILEFQKNPNKKSPPNSYKRLIKPSDPKSYLCKSEQRRRRFPRKKIRVVRGIGGQRKIIFKDRKNKKVVLASSGSAAVAGSPKRKLNRCIIKKSKLATSAKASNDEIDVIPESNDGQHFVEINGVEMTDSSLSKDCPSSKDCSSDEQNHINSEKSTASSEAKTESTSVSTKEKDNFMSNLELTNGRISMGYASDNELLSRKKNNLRNKKPAENRSRSESKKDTACKETAKSTKSSKKVSPNRGATAKTTRDRSNSSTKSKESSTGPTKKATKMESETDVEKLNTEEQASKSGKTKKPEVNSKKKLAVKSQIKQKLVNIIIDEECLDNETNNNILIENNNKTYEPMREDSPEPIMKAGAKKAKSRGNKFSNRKRHRARHANKIEEVIIPRRASATPRWSNGWCWEGEPFQGKVFLNSDDCQVSRTRYPAMRHKCGDIIRPGDCVLLRAGSKKNELPYVAKVASLWETPEDGEMMMSLLWYYRPEHTDQGRQPWDCADEVFASKHEDHNSVACIEDKCYVLTFNEYCRYRKTIKAMEEGIEEIPSIVPTLKQSTGREVPLNTNSELILFCRRIYEFRLKRLMKNPS